MYYEATSHGCQVRQSGSWNAMALTRASVTRTPDALLDFSLNEVRDDLAIDLVGDTGIVEDHKQGLTELLDQIHNIGLHVAKSECDPRDPDGVLLEIISSR